MRSYPTTLLAAAIGAGLCAAVTSALAATPSFNCRRATHEVERMICKDGELADLDHELAALYERVLARTPARQQAELKAEQRRWISERNDCQTASDARGCVKSAYEARIDELGNR
jgi:uncharacterized protein